MTDEWVDEATTFQRVRSVMRTTYDGQPASEIADRARVSETTARKHLEDLAESGSVESASSTEGPTLYTRSTESLILEEASDILERVETGELVQQIVATRIRSRDAERNERIRRSAVNARST
ncbi:hypothetical protein OB955_22195 [Halobacteria archaeon AArc-m2/3/4]|uniref:Uncharacterized protein n=1 Tax=Natronoglomus mannanivorans TaxID=2979990 RepID=A0ABT2QKE3_9EURY|nr:hypothetical protein [Halobacteria archaeon AArc-m2/3/4]